MPQTLEVEHLNNLDVLQLSVLLKLFNSAGRQIHVGEEHETNKGWILIGRSLQILLEFGLCCAPRSLIRPSSIPESDSTPYRDRALIESFYVSAAVRSTLGAPWLFSAVGPE